MKYKRLSDFADFRTERTANITFENYISTENMIRDKGGIMTVSSLPDAKTTSAYKTGDILLSNIRPYFKKIWFATQSGSCSNDVLVLKTKKNILPLFLYYVLSDDNFFNYDTITSKGTKMPRGTPNAIMKYLVPNIQVDKQTKIASILSAYDDLIENNNKRIKILEQMAENLYKEWFVRFRFPGYETAEFENGIPKGWEILRMENFCYVTDGTHDTPKETNLGVPLVTGRCIRNGFVDYDEAYLISEDDHNRIKKRSGLKSGDILFSNIGTVGNTCLVDYEREFSVKNVIIFKPPIRAISAYLYYWLISPSMQAIFSTQTNGASQQFVGLTFMRRIKILVPNKYIMTSFEKNVAPIIDAMMMLHKENQNLIKQRDLLLPRLMSGKLEV
mgnify:CR=1 FL=1